MPVETVVFDVFVASLGSVCVFPLVAVVFDSQDTVEQGRGQDMYNTPEGREVLGYVRDVVISLAADTDTVARD